MSQKIKKQNYNITVKHVAPAGCYLKTGTEGQREKRPYSPSVYFSLSQQDHTFTGNTLSCVMLLFFLKQHPTPTAPKKDGDGAGMVGALHCHPESAAEQHLSPIPVYPAHQPTPRIKLGTWGKSAFLLCYGPCLL